MKLRDTLNYAERDELQNVMRNYPVFAGDTISHHTARSLRDRGLIKRDRNGEWVPCWEAIRGWKSKD